MLAEDFGETRQAMDRRTVPRYGILWHCELAIPDTGYELVGALKDISAHGARFLNLSTESIDQLTRIGEQVMLYVKSYGWLSATIVWLSENTIGLHFARATVKVEQLLDKAPSETRFAMY